MFLGAKFCSHCGTRADRTEISAATSQLCPRCQVGMNAVVLGQANLRECPRCEGIWAEAASLEQICADREKQAAVLGMAATLSTPTSVEIEANIRYVPCPVCRKLMNRVNFAHCSKVVVDVCQQHGTWFDKDELRRIVEFIRSGGLEESRAHEVEELERRRRQLAAERVANAWDTSADPPRSNHPLLEAGLSAAAAVLGSLFDPP
jgi:Zn-finger nucleic acid-binding protein